MTEIRSARVDDGAALSELWAGVGLEVIDPEHYGALVANPSTLVLVAEDEGAPVAAAIASFDGWRAQIYHVAVLEPFRHRGLARDLMTAAEAELRKLGVHAIHVTVEQKNAGGLALSYSMGYAPQDEAALKKSIA